ncbi:MAG TPA: glycosyltransferase family 39 protein [Candidatus Baltobacteraceae bacterium]|nr:glycosyltransferase family 39 protein [Candidatus Baltobacteraceae bacterium]
MRAGLIGAAIAALVTIPGLGSGTLWDNSETAYGEVAREILLTHDWIVMHLNGSAWYVQPPLYFWIAALCAKIFGLTSFALRLPSALATIGMGWALTYAVARSFGTRAGIYAGVALSTCLMQAIVGRLAIMDALLDLAVTVSILSLFRALRSGEDRDYWIGALAAGLGFLAKGPVAPVIALLVIVPYALWQSRHARIALPSWRGWLGAAAVFLAVVAPWFLALVGRSGLRAVIVLIGHYTIGRYTGTIENQSGPAWYYLPVFILAFFPWIAFFPSALAYTIPRLRRSDPDDAEGQQWLRLAFCWLILPFLFFSFAQTKLPNYIALALPAPALLVALYLDEAVERVRSRSVLISSAIVPACILLLAIAIVWFTRDNRLMGAFDRLAFNLIYVGAAIFVGALVAFFLFVSPAVRTRGIAPYALGISMVFAFAFLALLALPQAEAFKPVPHLARIIDARRQPGDTVAILHVSGGNALVFYTRPRVYVLVGPHDPDPRQGFSPRAVICSSPRTWLIAPARDSAPDVGRAPRLVTKWDKAALYLYEGGDCSAGWKSSHKPPHPPSGRFSAGPNSLFGHNATALLPHRSSGPTQNRSRIQARGFMRRLLA